MVQLKRIVAGMFLCLMVVATSMSVGIAQQSEAGSGLQVIPTRTTLSVLPGEQKSFDVTVKNLADKPISVKTFLNDFESNNQTGEPQIIVDQNRQVASSLKNYLKGITDFQLAAGETKDVNLTMDVPNDTPPGGYFGAVRFAAVPKGADDGETQVSLTASVASLVFLEVSGDITEQIQISSIQALRDDKAGSFFIKEPNKVNVTIDNKGNSFSTPFGRVSVSRGNTEVYAYELNNKEPRGLILPNSTRVFSDEIKNVNKIGRYTITTSVSYGQGGEVIIQKSSFWYIPIWAVAIIAALFVAALIGAFAIFRKLGKKRKSKK